MALASEMLSSGNRHHLVLFQWSTGQVDLVLFVAKISFVFMDKLDFVLAELAAKLLLLHNYQ